MLFSLFSLYSMTSCIPSAARVETEEMRNTLKSSSLPILPSTALPLHQLPLEYRSVTDRMHLHHLPPIGISHSLIYTHYMYLAMIEPSNITLSELTFIHRFPFGCLGHLMLCSRHLHSTLLFLQYMYLI